MGSECIYDEAVEKQIFSITVNLFTLIRDENARRYLFAGLLSDPGYKGTSIV